MKMTMSNFFVIFLMSIGLIVSQTVSGKVVDADTGEELPGANIVVKGTFTGTSADKNGEFTLSAKANATLIISYVGYKSVEKKARAGSKLKIELHEEIYGQKVVVTASRKSESILEAPVTVEVMDIIAIKNAPKANFYEALGNMRAIDITTSSIAMPVINMRGFNSTSPDRFVQFVDGMDNQAPALNFPVGNMVGMSELDIEAVEIIYGAASALYGPNAFNGVISMKSKNPWNYQGLSVQIKSGSRKLFDGAFRYANAVNDKFAFKVNFQIKQADDWIADHAINNYGSFKVSGMKVSDVLAGALKITPKTDKGYPALAGFSQFTKALKIDLGTFDYQVQNTYAEKDIVDYDSRNMKINTSLYYRFTENAELSYTFNQGVGTGVYQGSNRYSLKNLKMTQHKLQLKGNDYEVKAYYTVDNAGDSYDSRLVAINLNKRVLPTYFGAMLSNLIKNTAIASKNFTDRTYNTKKYTANKTAALASLNGLGKRLYYKVGSPAWEKAFNEIINETDPTKGAKFFDESSILHFEAVKNFTFSGVDAIVGTSYRSYDPESKGTIFNDAPGKDDIKVSEFGFFSQFEKRLGALKLTAAVRFDKHQNFKGQFSPRVSLVYSLKSDDFEENNGNFRFSYQTAFRNPSLQDQYINLNVGPYTLTGNINGFTRNNPVALLSPDFNFLKVVPKIKVDAVEPEFVKTWEVGYKSIINRVLFVDLNYYQSTYTNFIAPQNLKDLKTGQVYSIDSNTGLNDVIATGLSTSMTYAFASHYSAYANYAYSKLSDAPVPNHYNTPKNKFNIGFTGRNISDFGFSVNFKHVDSFYWLGSGFRGDVPSYDLLDIAVTYKLNLSKQDLDLKLAVSNVLDKVHFEAIGNPSIGRFVTFQISIDL